ncbi:hypothetical protein Hypma_012859 [Hypsizygus marmoreus]|uniref:Uncharacterized protein n=1 Tax=Hypsizygus marmoreus TaxID=39966 RepID=A0A369JEW4_HYPMA|nr:hypothetical protein Hypma_012859 [Hypsizygus marmoreus]
MCPLCSLRKSKTYQFSDVRVKPNSQDNYPENVYVDTQRMLDTFSKDKFYITQDGPVKETLFVELVAFTPGQPDTTAPASRSSSSHQTSPRSLPLHVEAPHPDHYHHHSHHGSPPMRPHPGETFARSASQHVPPPPPWSRWGTVATPARPPSTQHRQSQSTSSRSTPQPSSSKKRKHEEFPEPEDFSRISSSSSSAPSSKRRAPPPGPPVSPPTAPARPGQTLSPSLAMIVSPVNQTVMTSPRSPYIPPLRNGSSGSPSTSHGGKPLVP